MEATYSRPEIRIPWNWKIVKIQLAEAPCGRHGTSSRLTVKTVTLWVRHRPGLRILTNRDVGITT